MLSLWRDIPGWEGLYEVSFHGRVRSVDREQTVIVRGCVQYRRLRGKLLRPAITGNGKGYLIVTLSRPGHQEMRYVHDLVAQAFIGERPEGMEVCHENGAKLDNHFLNLRYDTRSANALDRHKHGTMNLAFGENHFFHKLTESDVRWIRANAGRITRRSMADRFGVCHSTISDVINRDAWKHVA